MNKQLAMEFSLHFHRSIWSIHYILDLKLRPISGYWGGKSHNITPQPDNETFQACKCNGRALCN